jgi:hypothetical protein
VFNVKALVKVEREGKDVKKLEIRIEPGQGNKDDQNALSKFLFELRRTKVLAVISPANILIERWVGYLLIGNEDVAIEPSLKC